MARKIQWFLSLIFLMNVISNQVYLQPCVQANITGVSELNLGGDAPSIIETSFGDGMLIFSDRTHVHRPAQFNSGTTLLEPSGDLTIPLPAYLVGRNYVRFANNARDNINYQATVTADAPTHWYLLIDNRLDGPMGNTSSPNNSDPVLGGTLQWVIDGGWQRVNTGISPGGQADYTGIDEGGEGSLNQFYSVWTLANSTNAVTISNNGVGGSNMIALIAGCPSGIIVDPPECSDASITSVAEQNLGGDAPSIISQNYSDGMLAYSDRTHEHLSPQFDSGTGLLDPVGDLTIPLPSYLIGGDYIRFANNARDNANYLASVIADAPTNWYLLIDNRLHGPNGSTESPNNTDPVLGGTLQWVIDGGWQRVNTGISPNGQGDYTGLDEGGEGGLNQFYSVWSLPNPTNNVVVSNNGVGGSNMISLIANCQDQNMDPIPTLSQWGIMILFLSTLIFGLLNIRKKKTHSIVHNHL